MGEYSHFTGFEERRNRIGWHRYESPLGVLRLKATHAQEERQASFKKAKLRGSTAPTRIVSTNPGFPERSTFFAVGIDITKKYVIITKEIGIYEIFG